MNILLANFSKMAGDTGGAAKVCAAFANEMLRRGHRVSVVYSDDSKGAFFYPVDGGVAVYNLRHAHGKDTPFPFWLKAAREALKGIDRRWGRNVNDWFHAHYLLEPLRAILREAAPDVIVASQPMASRIFLCALQTEVPLVTMAHGDPEDYFHAYPTGELPAIARSAAHQVLLPSFAAALTRRYPALRVEVIGNVVPQYETPADLAAPKERRKILFVGRLERAHKRPHLLVEAFTRLAADFPDWDAEFWGAETKAAYQRKMRAHIERAGLQGRITFRGTTHDVAAVLRTGDIFVIPSAMEGWGMSLTEAMSMGLPAVGFRSCVAVNEIIRHEETGLLAEDGADALAAALARLMGDQKMRLRLGTAGREHMKGFDAKSIWDQWEGLLLDLARKERERHC